MSTHANAPTGPCGRRHAGSSPWSSYHSAWNDPKLKVLTPPLATIKTAGHRPVTRVFVLLRGQRPLW